MPEKIYNTPLVKKLGIKPDCRLLLVDAPDDFASRLVGMPDGVHLSPAEDVPIDVAVLFATEAKVLKRRFASVKKQLAKNGGLWIAWPKKASKVETDITFEVVQELGLNSGLVDNKVCAIDETWTALRFVYRKVDR